MAIDAFIPALQTVLIARGFLERAIHGALEPELGFDKLCDVEPFEARVGESKTMTREAILPPVTQDAVPIAAGIDLNQGMTPQGVTYEQFMVTLAERRGMMNLSLKMDETKIASEYMRFIRNLAQQAGSSRDVRAAQSLLPAYEGGNTYATAVATAATSVTVDNVSGFDTQYIGWSPFATTGATASPGIPQPVSPTNKLPVRIVPAANPTQAVTVNVTGVVPDATNACSAFSGGVYYGKSGTLTFDVPVTLAVGDTIQSLDGASVIRPNGKLSRSQLTSTDSVGLQQLSRARAKLENRKVPKLPNGMYAALVDAQVFADLLNDPAFRQATQGAFTTTPFFASGQVVSTLGLEFVSSSQVPIYPIGGSNSGLVERHAIICGKGCIVRAPSSGAANAARKAQANPGSGAVDVRYVDDVKYVTRGPIDVLADTVTMAWEFATGHVAPTDITSTPAQIASTDYARYKRAVTVGFASAA